MSTLYVWSIHYGPENCVYLVGLPLYTDLSPSNIVVTLKFGLGVVQRHWKWCRSIDHRTGPDLLLIRHCEYRSICYRFRAIWCVKNIVTLKPTSFKVTENATVRKLGYSFLFVFHTMAEYLAVSTQYTNVTVSHPVSHSTPAKHSIARQ